MRRWRLVFTRTARVASDRHGAAGPGAQRFAWAAAVTWLCATVGLGACTVSSGPDAAFGPDAGALASIVVAGAPAGATVWVDEDPVAVVSPDRPTLFRVAPGSYGLSVRAPGYLVYRDELDVTSGVYDLAVQLWPCVAGWDAGCEAE